MEDTNTLRDNSKVLGLNLEGQKIEEIVEIFIKSLYEHNLKEYSYSIKDKKNMDKNLKKFMNTCRKWVKVYASNIKRNYKEESIKSQSYLLDMENEEANIYLYIIESLYYFYVKYCDYNIELFKEYISNNNKTYVNIQNKEYSFEKFIYMSIERKIKEENKLLEKSLEKGNMNLNGIFSRVDLDSSVETEEGKEKEIELYSIGLFTLLEYEDTRSDEQVLKDNIKEMKRVQDKLSTVLTKSQVEFITTETYGCYYDADIKDFIMPQYSKQQRNQYFNQISKRINRNIKPFFIKKHNEKYVDDKIKYRRENRKKVDAIPRDLTDFIGKHTTLRTKGSVEIKEVEGVVTEYIPFGVTEGIINEDGTIEYKK